MRYVKYAAAVFSIAALTLSMVSCRDVSDTDIPTRDTAMSQPQVGESTSQSTVGGVDTEQVTLEEEIILDSHVSLSAGTVESYLKKSGLKLLSSVGTTLTADEYAALSKAAPNVRLITKVDFTDFTIDMTSSDIDISGNIVSNKDALEAVVSDLNEGTRLVMCDCGYTNEEMGALREKYPSVSFVWRLYLGKWSLRTDDEAFSVMIYASDTYKRLTSEDIEVLKYCTNLYAIDLGHQDITDLTTIGELTDLRVLILADNKITDLSPLANLKSLQYLELFVNRISDLSPLASCTELVDLNFGWNRVYDISSIYSLPKLERLWLPTNPVAGTKQDEIRAAFPNATIIFADENSVSSGWRTHERYFSMRGMFTNNKYDPDFVR
ncbi:MAG: leucine-rich repeat domain-containing protein [Clostridia bacterium]|nr:leucine-rich repeat domain-containing protein [Clostridia bacterium]